MLQGILQITLTLLLVVVLTPILGGYLARVFLNKKTFLDPVLMPLERVFYLIGDVEPEEDMTGWQYANALLISNSAMVILVFLLLIQGWLPSNPTGLGMPTWDTALHTSSVFNWLDGWANPGIFRMLIGTPIGENQHRIAEGIKAVLRSDRFLVQRH